MYINSYLNPTYFYLDFSISIRRSLFSSSSGSCHGGGGNNKQTFHKKSAPSSLPEQNESALTDHASHDNHVTNWPASTILHRESDRSTRWIKEAVFIRNKGWRSVNQDEGSYTLSHTYD